jgi:hypothetical protein
VLIAVSMLIDPAAYLAMAGDILKAPGLVYFAAVVGLLGGIALVLAHNVWVLDWRLILTLLGWISIIDSASWILLPKQVAAMWSPVLELGGFALGAGAIVLLPGAALCYFGYFAHQPERRRA